MRDSRARDWRDIKCPSKSGDFNHQTVKRAQQRWKISHTPPMTQNLSDKINWTTRQQKKRQSLGARFLTFLEGDPREVFTLKGVTNTANNRTVLCTLSGNKKWNQEPFSGLSLEVVRCVLTQSWDIRWNIPCKIIEPNMVDLLVVHCLHLELTLAI